MLKYKIMFQIFFVPKYFWVLEALIFGTLLPDHPVVWQVDKLAKLSDASGWIDGHQDFIRLSSKVHILWSDLSLNCVSVTH